MAGSLSISNTNSDNGYAGDPVTEANAALRLYTEIIRPKLAELSPEGAADFDREVERIERKIGAQNEERAICFLGNSGVGKSTLINALVAGKERILPQGGIGPLTALATSVKYSDEPYFRVEYLPANKLNNLIFAIDASYRAELQRQGKSVPQGATDLPIDTDAHWEAEAISVSEHGEQTKGRDYRKQARLLVKGNQNGEIDVEYLIDCLRIAAGSKPAWGRSPEAEDQARIDSIKECLAVAKAGTTKERRDCNINRAAFLRDLRDHASGFLAPLIKTLEVGWNADVLRDGMVLVDLPGLGVANDEYREVTLDWVRRRARAIVLVTDRSGLREAEAELLRSSGFLGRLLHSTDDPAADPVELIAVIVKIDLSADDSWRDDRDANDTASRPWQEHFSEKCDEARSMIVPQLREELRKIQGTVAESIRSDFQEVVDRLLDQMEVHAVSAPQYAKLLAQDDDDRARIRELDQSNVPELQSALVKVVRQRQRRLEIALTSSTLDFRLRLRSNLELIRNQWQDDRRTAQEIAQLSADLEEFLQPLRQELSARKGEFREFLRGSVPTEIEDLVDKAAADAKEQIAIFLASLGDAHWATLRATVRRGGAFVGARQIDLPADFAKIFEEPVAVIWSKKILSKLRKRTSQLADDYVALVKQVAVWAEKQGARVQPRVVRSLSEKMEADFKSLALVGKEAVDDLREQVKNKLLNGIQNPIRKRCERFVTERQDIGPGVKRRILDFFRELVPGVIEVATTASNSILQKNFHEVQEQISEAFKEHSNPLDTAAHAIVSTHEERLTRSDKKIRQQVLEWVDTALTGFGGNSGAA